MSEIICAQHKAVLTWALKDWLNDGPPVCFLQGFPGIGKTAFTRDLLAGLPVSFKAVSIVMPEGNSDLLSDLFLDLSQQLAAEELTGLSDAMEKDGNFATALSHLLRIT